MTLKNLELEQNIKDYIQGKVENLEKYADFLQDESVTTYISVSMEGTEAKEDKYSIKATINAPHNVVIRARVSDIRPESAADALHDKLMRQVEKYKTRLLRVHEEGIDMGEIYALEEEDAQVDEAAFNEPKRPQITSRKRFSKLLPLTELEAIEYMELIDHNFYLFLNKETNRFSVVYKRQEENDYGVIEPLYDLNDIRLS